MNTLEEKIKALPIEKRAWLLGKATSDPLGEAFSHKRVVHPGAGGGRIIMDEKEQQETFHGLLEKTYPTNRMRSVYIHIPFCERKCSYCNFFQNVSEEETMHRYTDALIDEILFSHDTDYIKSSPINAVYFGGGTPSTLEMSDLEKLITTVREKLPLASDAEITLEGRIHDFRDIEKVKSLMALGINRFSIGVQSFDTRVRQSIGRIDDRQTVLKTLRQMTEDAGALVIVDLIFGLPYQTMEVWQDDLKTQFSLAIGGGDLYQLNIFGNSDLQKSIEKGKIPPLPTTKEQTKYFLYAMEMLTQYPNVKKINSTHWAKDMRERSIYNSIAKSGSDVIAYGSGAGGFMLGYMWRNHGSLPAYLKLIEEGKKPIQFMGEQVASYLVRGELTRQIEDGYIDKNYIKEKYALDLEENISYLFDKWIEHGLAKRENDFIRLTSAGEFWQTNLMQAVHEALDLAQEGMTNFRKENVAMQDKASTMPDINDENMKAMFQKLLADGMPPRMAAAFQSDTTGAFAKMMEVMAKKAGISTEDQKKLFAKTN